MNQKQVVSLPSINPNNLGQKQVVSLPSIKPNNLGPTKPVPVKSRKTVSPLTLSLFFGVLFLVFASPLVFKLVNKLTSSIGLNILEQSGVPNNIGLLLHTAVFIFVSALLLKVMRRMM